MHKFMKTTVGLALTDPLYGGLSVGLAAELPLGAVPDKRL
jgi:hypothetical protein